MSKAQSLSPIFRPYKEGNLTPLTLREVLRDEYLHGAITWLLGYDASHPLSEQVNNRPMRAQEIGSAWQVAWAVLDSLYARAIFVNDQVHADLVQEIDRKLLGDDHLLGAAEWLLDRGQVHARSSISMQSKTSTCMGWDGRLFDTAIVLNALIRLQTQYPRQLSVDRMPQAVKGGLCWLFEHLSRQVALDWDSSGILAQVLQAFICTITLDKEGFSTLHEEYADKLGAGFDPVLHLTNTLLSRGQDPEDVTEKNKVAVRHWDNQSGVLRALTRVYRHLGPNHSEAENILKNLRGGLFYLEEKSIFLDHHGPRSNALAAYIEGCKMLGEGLGDSNQWDDNYVLSTLHRQCVPSSRFEDGSIYLDLYATQYFADCIAQAIEHWPLVQEQVIQLYDNALETITKEGRMTAERRQIYEMNRIEYELRTEMDTIRHEFNQRLQGASRREAWYHSLAAVVLGIVLATLGHILSARTLGFLSDTYLTVFLFWIGILITAVTAFVSRAFKKAREQE